jgi:hypothetical protein
MDTVEAPRHMPRDASEVVIGILPKEIQRVLIDELVKSQKLKK